MWPRNRVVVLLALALAACGGGGTEDSVPPELGPGADTPVAAVEGLIEAVNAADFDAAGQMSVPGQAALAALAEGATFDDVAAALTENGQQVTSNLWSGFAQGAGSLLTGDVAVSEGEVVTQGDVEFSTVTITMGDGETRTLLVRDVDGYRVDLFGSFGKAWADKMVDPVERLLTTQTDDARLILAELQEVVPSLLATTNLAGTSGAEAQQLMALVEVITRVR